MGKKNKFKNPEGDQPPQQSAQGQQQVQQPRPQVQQQQQLPPQVQQQQGQQRPQLQQQQQGQQRPQPQQQQQGQQRNQSQQQRGQQRPQSQQQQQGQPRPQPQQQQQAQQRPQSQQQQQGQQRPQSQQQRGQQRPQSQQQQQGQQWPQPQQQQGQQRPQPQQQQQGQQRPQSQQQQQGQQWPQPQQQQQGQQWPQPQQQQQGQQRPQSQQQQQGQQWPQPQQQQGQQRPQSQQQQGQQRPQSQQRPQGQQQQQGPQERPQQWPQGQQQWSQTQQKPSGPSQQTRWQQERPQGMQQQRPSSSTSMSSSSSYTAMSRSDTGKSKQVEVNYLRLDLKGMPDIAYHYDVTIEPDRPKKFYRSAFEQFNREFFKDYALAFDGLKSSYSVKRLPIDSKFEKDVSIDDGKGRKLNYKIAIKATENMEVDLSTLRTYYKERIYDKPMRALQCLEVVLANPCHNVGVRAGRSFFSPLQPSVDLGDGYELWTGLFQAMVLGSEPFLNVDISHKSFPKKMSILDYLQTKRDFDPRRKLDTRVRYELIDFLKGLRILYKDPSNVEKEYNFLDISEESASQRTFLHKESGKRMTVAAYFQSGRNIRLRYPDLNCLVVGSTVNSICLPIEFCEIQEGQAIKKKDDPRQVQQMIRYAATSTDERKRKIMNLLQKFQHNSNNLIKMFGIRIDPQFIDVPMRVLNAPLIEYLNRDLQRVTNGSWRMGNKTNFLDTKPKQHKWAVIYSNQSRITFNYLRDKMVSVLLSASRTINLNLEPEPWIDSFNQIDTKLQELKSKKYDLVMVVIPFRGTTYAAIKQAAELKHGILTQCIKEDTVIKRGNLQTYQNILLKINAKLNGTNHKIADQTHLALKNVMFLGADVTHPSPDQKFIPSVVGVAASHDENGFCYNMQYRLQKSTVENIEDMESIFSEHLKVYFRNLKKYPNHIIYYRDGVSDGQFKIVKETELRMIRAVCKRLKINPKLTCIVAVKRHHTRFFPKEKSRDKFNNVEPGTVVDQVIVHPNEVQFFMVSHQSIQGTAKPTRYNVIEDDAKMDINDLQKLTHNLCHLFPRCNRAVSYPTPVYLAHLVAFRGRVYLEGTMRFQDLKKEYERRQVHTDIMSLNPMYFV